MVSQSKPGDGRKGKGVDMVEKESDEEDQEEENEREETNECFVRNQERDMG